MNIKILVAAHKYYQMPVDQETYMPVFVGADINGKAPANYFPDNTGDNISAKNPHYNELTATYWGWKNLDCDVIGLVHYRRYFKQRGANGKDKFRQIISRESIEREINRHAILVPRKRKYYIESIESHYRHSHQPQGLDILREVFQKQPQKYQAALEAVLSSTSAHMFNMFIMKRKEFDAFASWTFNILSSVEKQINFDELQGNEKRVMGFISEFLLDVWLQANNKDYGELPIVFIENEHILRKARIFLGNKLSGGKKIINTHVE